VVSEEDAPVNVIFEIRARAGDPPFDYGAWCELVRSHPDLIRASPVIGKNPLTGDPITIRPRGDGAAIVVDGRRIGSVGWSEDGSPLVLAQGQHADIKPFVEALAQRLNGEYALVWHEASTDNP
jgi:hypothetical protein